jgi:hypothetical protein
VLLCFAFAQTCVAQPSPSAPLPIEVFGPKASAAITINLRAVGAAPRLVFECHSCGFNDVALDANPALTKAAVRINAGQAIALKRYTAGGAVIGNTNIALSKLAEAYGGIGGGFHTVRIELPVAGLVVGQNTVTFERVNY